MGGKKEKIVGIPSLITVAANPRGAEKKQRIRNSFCFKYTIFTDILCQPYGYIRLSYYMGQASSGTSQWNIRKND
jgi:hypothetical protein